MNRLIPALILMLTLGPSASLAQTGMVIGPLAQAADTGEDDDRPELFEPEAGDSDASNFETEEGDSDPDNFRPEDGDSEPDSYERILRLDELPMSALAWLCLPVRALRGRWCRERS